MIAVVRRPEDYDEMLTYEDALNRAREHLNRLTPPATCNWVLQSGNRVDDGWYFDYVLESAPVVGNQERFGGAPGFVIEDNGQLRLVSWEQLPKLQLQAKKYARPEI